MTLPGKSADLFKVFPMLAADLQRRLARWNATIQTRFVNRDLLRRRFVRGRR